MFAFNLICFASMGLVPSFASPAPVASQAGGIGLQPLPTQAVQLEGAWLKRVQLLQAVVLPKLYARLEADGALTNFIAAAQLGGDGGPGALHNKQRESDAEVYGWIEAVALSLHTQPNDDLRAKASAVIERIVEAQAKDGYLNTWYQTQRPKNHFRELKDSLELYSLGHLIRAGLAWRDATAEPVLFDAGLRAARLILQRFGPGKLADPPGFSNLEEALVRLADDTGEEQFADLALFLIEQRGEPGRKKRYGPEYQDDFKVLEERLAVGHAERGLALYTAVSEVARTRGYEDYWDASQTLWNDIVRRKMYLTGGVGHSVLGAASISAAGGGFGEAFELPNDVASCSTSAAALMVDFNQSLLLRSGHAVGADLVELELYNALLAGMSLDGETFFDDNPLRCLAGTQRVAQLPSTRGISAMARIIAGVGGLAFAHSERDLYLAQYIDCSAIIPLEDGELHVRMQTDYPRSGHVQLTVDPPKLMAFTLHVRIPGWCTEAVTLGVNDVLQDIIVTHGHEPGTWLKFERKWRPGDTLTLQLPMTAQVVPPHPKVKAQAGRVALRRGPEIYCLEAVDNGGAVFECFLPPEAKLSTRQMSGAFGDTGLEGVQFIEAEGGKLSVGALGAGIEPVVLRAFPYRLWGNRGLGAMNLWLAGSPKLAELPGDAGAVFESGYLVQASHVNRHTSLRALCDGELPRDSRDALIPRMTFEQQLGTQEWMRYDFDSTRQIDRVAVYWFDEGAGGRCRVPASWKVQWLVGEAWQDVKLSGQRASYGMELNKLNEVSFERVATRAVRVLLQLQPGASGGVLEWTVDGPAGGE